MCVCSVKTEDEKILYCGSEKRGDVYETRLAGKMEMKSL